MEACFIGQLLRQILSPVEVWGIPGMEDNQPVQLTQMGYSSESDRMLSFMGNIKFQRKVSLQAHVLRF